MITNITPKYRIYIFTCLLIFAVASTSCTDFLDKEPDDQLTLEMVFNDKTRTEDWLAGVYTNIPDTYWTYTRHGSMDALGDDLAPSTGWGQFDWTVIGMQQGNWNPTTNWDPNYFIELPKRIRSAYIFIENVKPNEEQLVTQQEVDYMKAEMRALIAYYYYMMLNYYGAIPLQLGMVDMGAPIEELQIAQTPFDEVVNWIDQELLTVSKLLPPYYNESIKYGRVTSVFCLAVRAKLLLFAASPLVNGNPDYVNYKNSNEEIIFNSSYDASKWDRAAQAQRDLIDYAESVGHRLYYEYLDNGEIDPFMSYQNMLFTRYNQGNREILFARNSNNTWEYDKHAQPRGTGGNGGLGVTQSLVDAFFMKNGLSPILRYNSDGSPVINEASGYVERGFSTEKEYRDTKWIEVQGNRESDLNPITLEGTYNMYVNREPRFYISILYNEAWFRRENRTTRFYSGHWDGGPTHDAPQNGYLVRKKVHPDHDPRTNSNPFRHGVLFRLGEFYLNYSEALIESENWSSNRETALLYLNKIRERAGVPQYGSGSDRIPAPTTQEGLRDIIRRERRVELNCENGIRWDDIRRWKQIELLNTDFWGMNFAGTEKDDDPNNPNAFFIRKVYQKRVATKKNYWVPIPQSEIDNNPKLRQLPFWDGSTD